MSNQPDAGEFPPLDARLVEPGARQEVVRGELVSVPPARLPHARPHARLASLVEAHLADGFTASVDLISRVAWDSDFAPDVSVRRAVDDLEEAGRLLDEMSFEIVSTQSRKQALAKAEDLAIRGVRRVFVLDVRRRELQEWSREAGKLVALSADAVIDDVLFVRPLPVAAVLSDAVVREAMAEALLARPNQALERELAAREQQGRAAGLVAAVLLTLRRRELEVDEVTEKRIRAVEDPIEAARLLEAAWTCASAAELVRA